VFTEADSKLFERFQLALSPGTLHSHMHNTLGTCCRPCAAFWVCRRSWSCLKGPFGLSGLPRPTWTSTPGAATHRARPVAGPGKQRL